MAGDHMIHVRSLSWCDFASVPLEQKSLYVCLCFLASELNSLQRLTFLSLKEYPRDSLYEVAARIQGNTLIRIYSSKCFEAQKFVDSCIEKTVDAGVKELAIEYKRKFNENNSCKGYWVAQHLRNKIGFHLDFREAIKSTRSATGDVNCNLYIQEHDGNCFFPLGEDVVQGQSYWGAAEGAKHAISSDTDHSSWVDWTVSTNAIVKDMHRDVYENFVLPHLPDSLGKLSQRVLSKEVFADHERQGLPLFIGGRR